MPSFASFSDFIANLSPRRQQPADRQLQHRQPSHRSNLPSTRRSPSPTPAGSRRRIDSAQHQPSLSSDLEGNRHGPRHIRFSPHLAREQDIDVSEQTTQSYENIASITTDGPATTRGQSRPSPFQSILDSTAQLGDAPQMLNQGSKRNGAQEEDRQAEARLLGLGARIKDKNAVKIKPGASMQNKKKTPGSNVAFRPQDGISRNSRESGPVRAQGKIRKHVPNQDSPHLQDAFEPSSRPIKRQRQDGIGECFHNEGVNDPLSPPTNSLSRLSPESSQFSLKSKNHAHPYRQSEYREVENSVRASNKSPRARRQKNRQIATSTQSPDERFTAQETQQQHPTAVVMESPSAKPGKKGLAPSVLDAVATAQAKHTQSLSTKKNGLRRRSASESSDELQGEVTTQPIPKNIDERQTQARLPTKEHSVSPHRSSPTDIVPTKFAGSNKKAKRKHNISDTINRFDIIYLQIGNDVTQSGVNGRRTAHINHEKIDIEDELPGIGAPVSIELRKVFKIFHGKDPSQKLRLFLSKGASQQGEKVDIEFSNSQMKNQLVHVLHEKDIAIYAKEPVYMDKAFQKHKFEAQNHQCPKRPLPEPDSTPPPASSSVRQKISSNLQGSVDESGSKRVKQDFSSIAKTVSGSTETGASESGGKPDPTAGVEIPVKKFREIQAPSDRQTRSTRRQDTDDNADDSPSHFINRSAQEEDENREKWKKPMVYPRIGKKRAEVNVEDRDRLREGEFLNDNLVGFYLRFLEDHLQRTNPDVAEGIYFFNSYFFPTLKNGRTINYPAVEKWTRNIDLFSYDYVIVPVNHDLHWYFAVICNLPSLDVPSAGPVDQSSAPVSDKEISTQPESEVHEISESPEPEPVSAATTTIVGAHFDQHGTEKEGKPAATEDVDTSTQGPEEKDQDNSSPGSWPDGAENMTSPPPKLPGRRWDQTDPNTSANQFGLNSQKKGRPDLKLYPRQTTIITFDSLDLPRSPTIRLLREYICQEAVSKRGVEVDPKEIKGMRARQIPLQPNFSDCGLYLLAYMEKFVQDPDTFITRVMQRDMDAHADWPQLGSGMLRHRLRKFLDDMYEEQKNQEGRSVMADRPRISFLLGDDEDEKEELRPATPYQSENSKTVQEDSGKKTNEGCLSVEIQVEATPPPSSEPERPKKSPQGKRKI